MQLFFCHVSVLEYSIFLFLALRIFLDSSDVGEVLRWPVSINILAPLANGLEGETLALDDDNHCGVDEREYGDVGFRLWESLFFTSRFLAVQDSSISDIVGQSLGAN